MNRLLLGLCVLPLSATAACNTEGERAATGQCPAGEDCSSSTPHGLHFRGAGLADDQLGIQAGPLPVAIGGTQDIALDYDPGDGVLRPLDLAYDADDDGGLGVTIDHVAGPVVTVRGKASRSNDLRITDQVDGGLFDRYALTGAALDRIALVTIGWESVPDDASVVWAAGNVTAGIALYGDVQASGGPVSERLVDTSMQVDLAGAIQPRWDEVRLAGATAGHHALMVTAGDKPPAPLDIEVVDGASSIVFQGTSPATIARGSSALVCFSALSSGRFVSGLAWTFRIDGAAPISHGVGYVLGNCIDIDAPRGGAASTITVMASAGGATMTLPVAIGAAAATHHRETHRMRATAGDRAAM